MYRDEFELDDDAFPLEQESPLETGRFIEAAIEQALRVQEWPVFFAWAQESLPQFASDVGREALTCEPDTVRVIAYSFGRSLWNCIPLPRLNFTPDSVPNPGQNEVCGCGSGRKYKHCCARVPAPSAFDVDALWPIVFGKLTAEQRSQALAANRVSLGAIAAHAYDLIDDDRATDAIALLLLIKETAIARGDEESAQAMIALALAYDELERAADADDLIVQLTALPDISPLRAHAWLHRACAAMDGDRYADARQFCDQAIRDVPTLIGACELDVQLLRAEGCEVDAQARATVHMAELLKAGVEVDDPHLGYLRATSLGIDPESIDPESIDPGASANDALDDLDVFDDSAEMPDLDGRLDQLSVWLDAAMERALPANGDRILNGKLVPSSAVAQLEARWRTVFPILSAQAISAGEMLKQYWSEPTVWVDFILENDLAFDSVEILADVSAAILLHSQSEWGAMEEELHVLWQRAAGLVRVAASAATDAQLDAVDRRGEAALECLQHIFEFESADFNLSVAIDYGTLMLVLDPHDRRNARRWLVNCFLLRDDNYHALGLAQEFQHDTQPATRFGYLLALLRLKRVDDARRLLPAAQQAQPYVVRYLTANHIGEPDNESTDPLCAQEYEAWAYRREMRTAWLATPGAMELLTANVDRKKLH